MLTNGQSDFFVRYIDPESHALRAYYPDFLIEMENGEFYIVEIKGGNLISKPETKAKVEYARQMFSAPNKIEYVFIPDRYADMILKDFLAQSKNEDIFATEGKRVLKPAQDANTAPRYKIEHTSWQEDLLVADSGVRGDGEKKETRR